MVGRITLLTFVLAVALASVATAADSGVYHGVTSEKGLVKLTVRRDRLVYVSFQVTFFGAGCAVTGAKGRTSVPIRHDRFGVTVHADHGRLDVHLTGHFRGRRVTGTLSGTDGGPACNTGKTTYEANA
jgi:hypothetical protein